MLDLNGIRSALIDLRWAAKQTQRGFAKLSGLNHGKIQRIESETNKKAIPIDDLEKWLSACGIDLLEFLSKYYVSEVGATRQQEGDIAHLERKKSGKRRVS